MKKRIFVILLCFCFVSFFSYSEENKNLEKEKKVHTIKNIDYPNWIIAMASVISSISTILIIIQIRKTSKGEIEDRLFKLINLHKKNVEDLLIIDADNINKSGQEIIMRLCNEINCIIKLIDANPTLANDFNSKDKKIFAYLFICHGFELANNPWFESNYLFKKYVKKDLIKFIALQLDKHNQDPNCYEKFLLSYNGFINPISRYFRQLFQIIKFIDEQKFISKKTKYQYIKILRSSLTNREEEFIFNNSISPYGSAWIKNKYFTKYKIIKNIPFYYIYGYDPRDWFVDELNISKNDISKYFEHYEYKEA